jgi:putative hemolysin
VTDWSSSDNAFQIAGMISNTLQNMALFNELPKMKDRDLRMTVGKPLQPEDWSHIPDDKQLVNHFRDKVEILGQS